jgi:hypothetical protein
MDPITEVRGMLSEAKGQETFLEWLGSGVTQKMLACARLFAKPKIVPTDTASWELGRCFGANQILDFMSSPSDWVGRDVAQPTMSGRLAMYGAEEILKENK